MKSLEIDAASSDLSPEQRQLVLSTLQSVLDSTHFSKSKRYPAFLEYIVRAALNDSFDGLKERTIGVEVFGRPADYDTSADPVVRIAAGEVRRRMAVYFSEHPESPVRIDIHAGSYRAVFHFHSQTEGVKPLQEPQAPKAIPAEQAPAVKVNGAARAVVAPAMASELKIASHTWGKWTRIAFAAAFLGIVVGAWWLYHQRELVRQGFWWPVLGTQQPALILVGSRDEPPATATPGGQPPAATLPSGEPPAMAVNDAIVTAKFCSIFSRYGLECKIAQAGSASMADLHGKSIVLVGAFNNPWTLRLLAPLPYQFQGHAESQPAPRFVRSIVEQKATGAIPLASLFDQDNPSAEFSKDYAIIGRFHSDITDGMVVVGAGLGLPGTTAAGEIIASPEKLRDILSLAPKDWNGSNFEAVLNVDVVQGGAGHSQVIASRFW